MVDIVVLTGPAVVESLLIISGARLWATVSALTVS
jgi:hypothetical protein